MMNKFPFPWTLTGIHTLCGAIGSQACLSRRIFVQQRLTSRENIVLIAFSVLYTVNIAVSNLSLNLVTVPVRRKSQNQCIMLIFLLFISSIKLYAP